MNAKIAQEYTYMGDNWWNWSVWLEGPNEELDRVDYVQYTLHHTFPNPVRRVTDRAANFRLSASGWGTFVIYVLVVAKDGEKTKMEHELQLYYPSGKTCTD